MSEPLLKYFKYRHMPENLHAIGCQFWSLANQIALRMPNNSERDVALRKLLEARDAVFRALEE